MEIEDDSGDELMARVTYKQFGQLSFGDLEVYSVLPEHPIWSRAAELIDFQFADVLCAPLYSTRGPRPYAPSLKLKLHLIQRYYTLSDREMEERIIGDLFIKRFLGVPVSFIGFDHSTLGLDRDRMGSELFNACHHHMLAQAKQQGLWGDKTDIWLVDSFPSNGHVVRLSAYRLIKQAILQIVNHLKRAHRTLFNQLQHAYDWTPLTAKLPPEPKEEEIEVAFSNLVVLAYSLLYWFESDSVRPIFWSWTDAKRQLASLERQAMLYRVLTENVQPQDPNDPKPTYKKLPRKERPQDRLLSAVDPDLRAGAKTKTSFFLGDKIQVVTSAAHNIVLNAEPIAGNEPDGDRLIALIHEVFVKQQMKPKRVVADSAYGYGRNRLQCKQERLRLVAPLKKVGENPTGLFSNEQFLFDEKAGTVTCPAGQVTSNAARKKGVKDTTYYTFSAKACRTCLLRDQCTTSTKHRRSVTVSDYHKEFRQAQTVNRSEAGKALLAMRSRIERKNHEMKNHHGLGHATMRSREKRRRIVKLVSMVVNLKQIVKQRNALVLSFNRKRPAPAWHPSAHLQGTLVKMT